MKERLFHKEGREIDGCISLLKYERGNEWRKVLTDNSVYIQGKGNLLMRGNRLCEVWKSQLLTLTTYHTLLAELYCCYKYSSRHR